MVVNNKIATNIFIRNKNKRNSRQNIYVNMYIQLNIYLFLWMQNKTL